MFFKEFALFSINFIIGIVVVYLGMFVMKFLRELDTATLLQQLLIYVFFTAALVNYAKIYLASKLF